MLFEQKKPGNYKSELKYTELNTPFYFFVASEM